MVKAWVAEPTNGLKAPLNLDKWPDADYVTVVK